MKILQWGFPYGAARGGRELSILELSEELAAAGDEVHLFRESDGSTVPFHEESIIAGVHHHYINLPKAASAGALISMMKVMSEISPDVIHTHYAHDESQFFLHAFLRKATTPLVITLHDIASLRDDNPLIQLTSTVVAPSAYMANRFSEENKHNIATRRIFHGVDLPERVNEEGPLQILFAGHLAQHKGLIPLMSAWSSLSKKYPEVSLTIAGIGPEMEAFKHYAATSSAPSQIEFVGWLERDELNARLGKNTIVVVPSLIPEAFGLIAAESMAHGSPVITSDSGALPEVIGSAGSIASNSVAIGERLDQLLSDVQLRSNLSRAGRTRVEEHFSISAMVRNYQELYRSLI